MSQVNRVPRGLQSVLNSQNFGRNPDELGQTIVPIIDIGRFYEAETLSVKRAQNPEGVQVTPLYSVSIGPELGKNWFVYHWFVQYNEAFAPVEMIGRAYLEMGQRQGPLPNNADAFLWGELIWESTNTDKQRTKVLPGGFPLPSGASLYFQHISGQTTISTDIIIGALVQEYDV